MNEMRVARVAFTFLPFLSMAFAIGVLYCSKNLREIMIRNIPVEAILSFQCLRGQLLQNDKAVA